MKRSETGLALCLQYSDTSECVILLLSKQILYRSHPQFNGLAGGGKDMKNWIAASNACEFISTSKPRGGGHDCPHFPFSAAGFDGCRMLYIMRQALSVA